MEITDEDVKYMDSYVCILHPYVNKGVIVWHSYDKKDSVNLEEDGIKSGYLLNRENNNYGRITHYPYIFFRAPEKEYMDIGEISKYTNRIYIRVDPDRTFVFSSEIRARFIPKCYFPSQEYDHSIWKELLKSIKTLREYFFIVEENEKVNDIDIDYKILYNLYTSKKCVIDKRCSWGYPYDNYNINCHSEIIIFIQHLTKDFFVN
jgi:hypothetical protein